MTPSYDIYPRVVNAIEQFSRGLTLTRACDAAGVPIPTFEKYVKADKNLQDLFADAERRGYDAMADALLRIDDENTEYGRGNPAMAKIQSDNIKWLLSKRDNKRFGEKVEIKHEISLDRAITDALENARSRVANKTLPPPDTIDVEFELVDEDAEIMRSLGL